MCCLNSGGSFETNFELLRFLKAHPTNNGAQTPSATSSCVVVITVRVLTMSKCMLPPLERGIAAMLTRRAEDCWVSKGQKKFQNYTYENTATTASGAAETQTL